MASEKSLGKTVNITCRCKSQLDWICLKYGHSKKAVLEYLVDQAFQGIRQPYPWELPEPDYSDIYIQLPEQTN